VSSKSCQSTDRYVIVFLLYASGGKPPYTYFRDIDQIGGPINGNIGYKLIYGTHHPAVGTFFLQDSTGQRVSIKFFVPGITC